MLDGTILSDAAAKISTDFNRFSAFCSVLASAVQVAPSVRRLDPLPRRLDARAPFLRNLLQNLPRSVIDLKRGYRTFWVVRRRVRRFSTVNPVSARCFLPRAAARGFSTTSDVPPRGIFVSHGTHIISVRWHFGCS